MNKIHFVGIGGIGMSALARICLARGNAVSGSDIRPNSITDNLASMGAVIYNGHSAGNLPHDTALVVRSACIKDANPEIVKAEKKGIPVILRSNFLKGVLAEASFSIAVTGTHGKTTTSALIAHIMTSGGKDPTFLVGGELIGPAGNAKAGSKDLVVAELDESDGYFSRTNVSLGVVTNIEKEHMEVLGPMARILNSYRGFVNGISSEGVYVFNGEDKMAGLLAASSRAKTISFGINGNFDISCTDYEHMKKIEFDLLVNNRSSCRITSALIGRHNLMNILAACAVGIETGLDARLVKDAVKSFRGVRRRFELAGRVGDITVIEDYAHHPTEIASVIKAARDWSDGRIITIFQPHRFSRTRDLCGEFSASFHDSDIVVLTDIYSADEETVEGINARDIYKLMDKKGFERLEFMEKEKISEFILSVAKDNDLILVLGAGDIGHVSGVIVDKLREKSQE